MRWALAAVVAITLALAAACGGGDDETTPGPDGDPGPFYIEAEFTVISNAATQGTDLPPEEDRTDSALRWWSQSVTEFRQEFDVRPEGEDEEESQFVGSDGEISVYNSRSNSYSTQPHPGAPDGAIAWPLGASLPLGPSFDEAGGTSVDAAIAMVQQLARPDSGSNELDEDTVAGRPARVFEWEPASCSQDSSGEEVCSGSVRAWIDSETGFFLRFDIDDPGATTASAEVTTIDYSPDFDDGIFEFDPPEGATPAE